MTTFLSNCPTLIDTVLYKTVDAVDPVILLCFEDQMK